MPSQTTYASSGAASSNTITVNLGHLNSGTISRQQQYQSGYVSSSMRDVWGQAFDESDQEYWNRMTYGFKNTEDYLARREAYRKGQKQVSPSLSAMDIYRKRIEILDKKHAEYTEDKERSATRLGV